jgi:two-component system response regulator HydG
MPDTLTLAGARAARFGRSAVGARELVGRSAAILRAQELTRRAAAVEGGVLLVADRGADVESVARELHERSRPPTAPYVAVDCAAGDPLGLARLLFGDVADQTPSDLESVASDSRIAAACGGTLFLRDVADLAAAVQTRLARTARDGEARIDGRPTATGFRLIASASPGIDADVRGNRFRADLYRRLAVSRIDLPPLRDRAEDVPALAVRVLEELCAERHLAARTFTQTALALLGALTWPGNLAELQAVVERVVADARADVIQIEDLLPALHLDRVPAPFAPAGSLREARLRFERDYIAAVLQHHGWRMADAARTLGIQRPNLYRKARQLGIPLTKVSE